MDRSRSPEVDDVRRRVRAFVAERVLPLEAGLGSFEPRRTWGGRP